MKKVLGGALTTPPFGRDLWFFCFLANADAHCDKTKLNNICTVRNSILLLILVTAAVLIEVPLKARSRTGSFGLLDCLCDHDEATGRGRPSFLEARRQLRSWHPWVLPAPYPFWLGRVMVLNFCGLCGWLM